MLTRKLSEISVVTLALATGCSNVPEDHVVRTDPLTGGQFAKDGQFPSTIRIGCTAAVVGPRHILTAAHCVWNGETNAPGEHHHPGDVIHYTDEVYVGDGAHWDEIVRDATVRQTHVPDGVIWSCQDGHCGVLDGDVYPDVAVIEVEEDLGVPPATVDLRPVEVDDPLVIMGYGCENGLGGPGAPIRLRYAEVAALPASALDHETTWIPPGDPRYKPLLAQYSFTPGQGMDPDAASLCPGDSGGPMYRNDGNDDLVVGVNAYYSFTPESSAAGLSYTNWHTRLDWQSRFDIGAWLAAIGVRTTWSGGACGILYPGEVLHRDESRQSCDGRFELIMQGDGNLVLNQSGVGPLWASGTHGSNGERTVMQADGNVVVYGPDGPLWASGTHGRPSARLFVQDDGNLVVYTPEGEPIWASGTCCR